MKRLSMDNEQLAWRLSQSALDAASTPNAALPSSTSPPTEIGSTPDMLRLMSSMTRLPTSPGAAASASQTTTPSSNYRRQRPKSMVALSQSSDSSGVKLRRPRSDIVRTERGENHRVDKTIGCIAATCLRSHDARPTRMGNVDGLTEIEF
jgi:hypothetical protein